MPIQYPVGPGTILLCDYSMGGFRDPEMVKRRPAIVVSPRLPHRNDLLCAVVPLSGSEPVRPVDYVVRLELAAPLPHPFPQSVWWAKCDMIATVGFQRLDLFRTERDQSGKRKYIHPKLSPEDLERVQGGILHGLGLGKWIPKPEEPLDVGISDAPAEEK
jgi:mRNA interferase MazF